MRGAGDAEGDIAKAVLQCGAGVRPRVGELVALRLYAPPGACDDDDVAGFVLPRPEHEAPLQGRLGAFREAPGVRAAAAELLGALRAPGGEGGAGGALGVWDSVDAWVGALEAVVAGMRAGEAARVSLVVEDEAVYEQRPGGAEGQGGGGGEGARGRIKRATAGGAEVGAGAGSGGGGAPRPVRPVRLGRSERSVGAIQFGVDLVAVARPLVLAPPPPGQHAPRAAARGRLGPYGVEEVLESDEACDEEEAWPAAVSVAVSVAVSLQFACAAARTTARCALPRRAACG